MLEAEIARVESALGCSIPPHYRDFMIRHGEELKRAHATLPLRTVLYTDPGEMIDDNAFSRVGDVFRIGEEQLPWPENYLLVATNGAGDYWYVYRDGPDLGVWFWSHEDSSTTRLNESLDEYLQELRADLQNPEPWQF